MVVQIPIALGITSHDNLDELPAIENTPKRSLKGEVTRVRREFEGNREGNLTRESLIIQ